MTEEKTMGIEPSIAKKENVAANPQAIPAPVDAPVAAPIVLSQAPPVAPSDKKPVVDKASTIIAPTPGETK